MNTYTNPARFFGNSTKTKVQLIKELNELNRNGIGTRPDIISTKDIFGDEKDRNYSPAGAHLSNITVDGRSISFKDIIRGVAGKISNEHPNSNDITALADFFNFVSSSLSDSVDLAELTLENNNAVRKNTLAIEQVKANLDAQTNYENSLSQQDLNNIELDELTQNTMLKLKADNEALRAGQETLMNKLSKLMPKKKVAKPAVSEPTVAKEVSADTSVK